MSPPATPDRTDGADTGEATTPADPDETDDPRRMPPAATAPTSISALSLTAQMMGPRLEEDGDGPSMVAA